MPDGENETVNEEFELQQYERFAAVWRAAMRATRLADGTFRPNLHHGGN